MFLHQLADTPIRPLIKGLALALVAVFLIKKRMSRLCRSAASVQRPRVSFTRPLHRPRPAGHQCIMHAVARETSSSSCVFSPLSIANCT
eukprot:COSAG04_NODE_863_length_9800_cov_12.998248_9_plen_89_part_00